MNAIPHIKGRTIFSPVLEFQRDQLGFLTKMREHGDLISYQLGPLFVYQINHPDLVQELLIENADNIEKAPLDHAIFGRSMGQGLLSSEGDFHRRQRKLIQPAFHHKRLENYARLMTDFTGQMLGGWRDGGMIDAHVEMTRLTLYIVTKALYSADVSGLEDGIGKAIHALNHYGEEQYKRGFVFPKWLPIKENREIQRSVEMVDSVMMPIIERRRKSGEDNGDLLSMLLMAQDESDGTGMTDRQVRDEAVSLFIAGHETTANALTWTFYLLSQNPDVEAKLHAELARVLGGRTPTLGDLQNLKYVDLVIKESMRLYPPAWILNGRVAKTPITLGGQTLKPNGVTFISPYVIHRDPRFYDQPEQFIPERWADGLEKRLPRYAYFPFGGGERVCIGNGFALMEARLVLATVAQTYRLSLAPGQQIEPMALITLRPRAAVNMRLERRLNVAQPVEQAAETLM